MVRAAASDWLCMKMNCTSGGHGLMWRLRSSLDFRPIYLRTSSCGLIASSSPGTVITLRWRVEDFGSCWRYI